MKSLILAIPMVVALALTGCLGSSDSAQLKSKANTTKDPGNAKADLKHDDHKHDDHKHAEPGHAAADPVKAERDKLSAEDRTLVEAQEWCAVSNNNRLGVMGPPIKIMVKDKPVFLCCEGCSDAAKKDEDKTLAKVEELKEKKKTAKPAGEHAHEGHHHEATDAEIKAAREKLSPEDRVLADAQEWCPIMVEDRLGCSGAPIKVTLNGEVVFLCCNGCKKDAEANPEKTLAKVEELKKKKAAGGK